MRVNLEPDKQEIVALGNRRYDLAMRKGRTGYGILPENRQRHVLGITGEFAVARALGIEPEWTRATCNGDPDCGFDGVWRGIKYEVKYSTKSWGDLIYNPKMHKLWQDAWVLATRLARWEVNVAGWVWVKEMASLWHQCHFDKDAYCILQADLRPFSQFKRMTPNTK